MITFIGCCTERKEAGQGRQKDRIKGYSHQGKDVDSGKNQNAEGVSVTENAMPEPREWERTPVHYKGDWSSD